MNLFPQNVCKYLKIWVIISNSVVKREPILLKRGGKIVYSLILLSCTMFTSAVNIVTEVQEVWSTSSRRLDDSGKASLKKKKKKRGHRQTF